MNGLIPALILMAAISSLPVAEGDPPAMDGDPATPVRQDQAGSEADRSQPKLLEPIPARGEVPPLVKRDELPPEGYLRQRAEVREYRRQIRRIRYLHFRPGGRARLRAEGIEQIREFTDPAAFRLLITELGKEKDDVRLAVLDHLAAQGEAGQPALAWTAIYDTDPAIRNEATLRLTTPAEEGVLAVLDEALRSRTHAVANRAGGMAGTLGVLDTIPLLIFGQVTTDRVENQGDLAWIAVQTQTAYVQRLEAVTGSGSGAYQPVMGVVNEGSVLRIMDAVAYFYRTEVHRVLVSMTTADWGSSTEELGYDLLAWWHWYNEEYVPYKNEQILVEHLAGEGGGAP